MNTLQSPLGIKILLHCHVSPEPLEHWDNSTQADYIQMLRDVGAIEIDSSREPEEFASGPIYRTTPLGKAWVAMLCNLPPPTVAFVDQAGKVVGP